MDRCPADFDLRGFSSNEFEMEWPPRTGKRQSFPEIDRVAYDGGVTFPNPDGASMALLSPDLDNNLGQNWFVSADPWPGSAGDAGSPGSAVACWAMTPGG